MFLNIRRLGAIFVVLTALGCASAGTAPAKVIHDFTAGKGPVIITGEQLPSQPITYEFGEGWTLTCLTNKVNGTIKSLPTSEMTLEFTESDCLLNEMTATVDTQDCKYVLSGETTKNEHAYFVMECGFESKLLVTVSGCTLEIGPQTYGNSVGYKKTEAGGIKDVDVTFTSEKGVYSKTGFLCAGIGGTGNDLSILGTYTMKAYEDKENKEGSQVSFTYESTVVP